jgi:hypothetical protein
MSAMATPASSTLVTLARRVASAAHACRKSASAKTRIDSAVKKCATWNKPTDAAASVAATAPARDVSRRAAVRAQQEDRERSQHPGHEAQRMEQVWQRDRGSGGLGGEGLGDVGALVGVARHQRLRGLAAPEAGPLGGDHQLEHQRAIGGVVRPEVPAGEPAILGGQRLVHHEALFVHVQGVGQPPVGCGQARTTASSVARAMTIQGSHERCCFETGGAYARGGRGTGTQAAPLPASAGLGGVGVHLRLGGQGAESWLARARARPRCATRREASRSGGPESTMLEFGRRVSYTHGPACPAALRRDTHPRPPPVSHPSSPSPSRERCAASAAARGNARAAEPAGHRAGLPGDARG